MKRVKCIRNSAGAPFYYKEEIYDLVDEFTWQGEDFYRIYFKRGVEINCPASDFVILGKKIQAAPLQEMVSTFGTYSELEIVNG